MEPTTQDTEITSTPASEGNIEDWKAKFEDEKRRNQGIMKDLQQEREQRQSYQQMVSTLNSRPEAKNESHEDPAKFIEEINTTGRKAIISTTEEVVKPTAQIVHNLVLERDKDKAMSWLARQESRRTNKMLFQEDMDGSDLQKEILQVARENNLLTMSWADGTKAAYQIWQKNKEDAEKAAQATERDRDDKITQSSGEPARSVPKPSGRKVYGRQEARDIINSINASSPSEKDKAILAEISTAGREGRIKER